MKLNPLSAALVGAGIAVVGTAGAIDLPHWLKGDDHPALVAQANAARRASRAGGAAQHARRPGAELSRHRQAVGACRRRRHGRGRRTRCRWKSSSSKACRPAWKTIRSSSFFRGVPGFGQRGRENPSTPFSGLGSGFIISPDGLILTNAHVVRDAKDVTVKLSDRREYTAKVLGIDTATDIAVLRIDAKNLPVVRLGDPRNLEVGDPVLAIGAPYGLEQTATAGIVSAKGRSLPGDAVVPFIQTDAAVNPGNSGGPLFDGSGSVVGINSQIYSRSGGFQGVSFAIPINVALKVKDQIVATGKAEHGRLGVTVQDLNQSLADSFGLKRRRRRARLQRRAEQRRGGGRPEVGRRDHRGQRRAGRPLGRARRA